MGGSIKRMVSRRKKRAEYLEVIPVELAAELLEC